MIRAYSERLLPPFSGQVQIAQSDKYRALTMDGLVWEIQYIKRSHIRVATIKSDDLSAAATNPELVDGAQVDEQLVEMLNFLAQVKLPFAPTDYYEYWLLDASDDSPLALIYSCSEAEQQEKFPTRAEWTALPAAVMPIDKTETELRDDAPPVNYRLERLVAERAGMRAKAAWFDRRNSDQGIFPPLLIREDWSDSTATQLCERYIRRQSSRLLMLHDLSSSDRQRLEQNCHSQALEVARFFNVYPEIWDQDLIQALRVEARLRSLSDQESQVSVHNRRDGVLYM